MQVYMAAIEAITKEEYEGDVWNLETENEEYVVRNIVVHNCPHNWSVKPEKVAPDQCQFLWVGS